MRRYVKLRGTEKYVKGDTMVNLNTLDFLERYLNLTEQQIARCEDASTDCRDDRAVSKARNECDCFPCYVVFQQDHA